MENQSLQNRRDVAGVLRRLFFAVFALVFGVLFLQVLFNNIHYPHYNPLAVIPLALLWLAVVYGLYCLTERFAGFLQKRERFVLAGFILLEVLVMLWFYSQLAAYPTRDFERVFTGAVNYAVNGFIEEPYLTYFYRYPNNMPLTIVLEILFRFTHKFGFDNFYVVGALFNGACILLGYVFVYLCCRRLFSVQRGFFALGLLFLCLPLQCYISIFYTDAISMWFVPFALYMYLRLRAAKTWKGRIAAILLLCAVSALGMALKYSVVLVLIALGLDMLLRLDWKALLATAGAFLVFFFSISAAFNSIMYRDFLDKETSENMATPFSAWIMMGLSGDGAHDPGDNYLVWNYETGEEMREASMQELKNRLSSFTPVSFAAFMNQKALKSWGSGNLDYTHTVADAPMKQTFLVEAVSENGTEFWWFDHLTQGYHVMLFCLLAVGAAVAAKKKDYTAFVPYLAIFGLFLFLLLWESGNRYLLNYIGMFTVAGAFAVGRVLPKRLRREKQDG